MTKRRTFIGMAGAAALALGLTSPAQAADFEFNLQSFLPAQATIPAKIIDPWADKIEKESGGRIKITRYPSMQLGGAPPHLLDQVVDGVIDITWNVIGYTPGRFPSTEVFELPFMMNDARAASAALWTMMDESLAATEFADYKVLGAWAHGPGMFHTKSPVSKPEDLQGMKIRGGSRLVNSLLKQVGATPVGMPVPAVSEALSKGVLDGTTIPWEVTTALKVAELVDNHTEFTGPALYTLTFVLAMNKGKWESLPADLQKVMDDNSGLAFSVSAGDIQQAYDDPARKKAVDRGNNIITLDAAQSAVWAEAASPIHTEWVAEMKERGIDGQALIDQAKKLMADFN